MSNIYEMYVANGNASGFWVQRDSWGPRTVARILSVDGKESGALRGRAPYYGNPDVLCEFYLNGNLNNASKQLPCPGTFGYIQIKQPDFSTGQ